MAMAKARNPREALLWALSDLEENDFKKLKFYLRDMTLSEGQPPLARGELEGLIPVDLAELLISKYGEKEAVKVVLKGLKVMNLLELVDQLSHICLHGECGAGEGEGRMALGLPSRHGISRAACSLYLMPSVTLSSSPWCPRVLGGLHLRVPTTVRRGTEPKLGFI